MVCENYLNFQQKKETIIDHKTFVISKHKDE